VQDDQRRPSADGAWRWDTWELARAWLSPDRPRALKRFLAREMVDMGDIAGGPGDLLISERNAIAVRTLQRVMRHGDRHVAIFYGAAHLPDLARRLQALSFRRTQSQWLTVWDLGPP